LWNRPPGSPQFLTLPFEDDDIIIQQAWYYDFHFAWFCPHSHDIEPPTWHCATDYINGLPESPGETWQTFAVVAAAGGMAQRFTNPFDGTVVVIEHEETTPTGERFYTRYSHLEPSSVVIPSGQWVPVDRGALLGMAGNTGTTFIHLHFDVVIGGFRLTNDQTSDPRVDPYDRAGGLLRQGIRPTKGQYQEGALCGPNHLWVICPL
jgi:hypothetical protein